MKAFYLFLIIAAFLFAGCGNVLEWAADDESYEAKLEEARMALDKEDYEGAKSILEGMDSYDPTVAQYLSNAYAGMAGLDTFTLLETIDAFAEGQAGSIDMVGKVLGDEEGALTAVEIDEKISDLTNAIDALENLEKIVDLTDEQEVQLGLLSLNRAALTIADIISEDKGVAGVDADVTLTEEWIRGQYTGKTIDFSAEATPERLATLSADITNVADSIDAIANIIIGENDLAVNFDAFRSDVDADGNEGITVTELQGYINLL